MRSLILAAAAALAFATSAGAAMDSYMNFHPDAQGRCHDTNGKFVSADHCKRPAPPPPNCAKGKLCGHACIPKDHVCHKG